MKLTKAILGSAVAVLTMTSCLGDESAEQTVQFNYNNSINYVQDVVENTYTMLEGASYDLDFDLTAGTVTVEITKMMVSSSVSPMTIKLNNIAYSVNKDGAMVVSVPAYTSVYGGETHSISDFRMTQLNRIIPQANVTSTVYTVDFMVDNRYRVRAYQKSTIMLGETNVFDNTDGMNQKYDGSTAPYYFYELKFNEKVANVSVYNLKYGGVQQSAMQLKDIPFKIDPDGIKIEKDSPITPTMSTADPAKSTVTDFKAHLTSTPTMTVNFTIAELYKVSAKLSAIGTSSSTGH